MARIRSVKPELRTSLTVAEWPREVRYFWVLLWGYLDDHGRGVDEPRLIKADCFPLDDDLTAADIDKWLDIFEESGAICRYAHAGRTYLHVPRWTEHQKPQHPVESKLPPCDQASGSCGFHEPFMSTQEEFSGDGFSNTPSPTSLRKKEQGDVDGEGEVDTPADPARPDVQRLCAHLADRIEANGSKRPAITQKWRDAARLMLDRDGRTEEQAHIAIDWCQDDEFWRTNVLSMPTLRRQYDRLRMQAQRQRARASPPVSTTDQRVLQAQALKAELAAEAGAQQTIPEKTVTGSVIR